MDFIKIRFGDDFDTSDAGFGQVVENLFRSMSPVFNLSEQSWKPQMDIYESPDEIIILAEISGVNKEDLEVEINSKAVRIFGLRDMPNRIDNASFRLAEIQYGRFERTLYLPVRIDADRVSASYQDGMLTIRLAKHTAKEIHTVPISEG